MMDLWVIPVSVLLAFAVYYNTLNNGFVYDDRRAILSNPDVIGQTPLQALFENDFWGTPMTDLGSHGSYRPLCVAMFRLNYAISEFEPWGYHLFNIILHCSATALVVIVAQRLLPHYCRPMGTAVVGLTFAAHPIHTEAVAGVVGRADLAACNLYLLSFLLYTVHVRFREHNIRKERQKIVENNVVRQNVTTSNETVRSDGPGLVHRIMLNLRRLFKADSAEPLKKSNRRQKLRENKNKSQVSGSEKKDGVELGEWCTLVGTLLLAIAATLCKEPAIMVLPLCIVYDVLNRGELFLKDRWRSGAVMGTGTCALLYWRLQMAALSPFSAADNPASRDPSPHTRFYTFAYLPAFNFFLLLCPSDLSFDWSMESIPLITTLEDARNICSIVFYVTLTLVTGKMAIAEYIKYQESKRIKKLNPKIKPKSNQNNKHYNRGQRNVTGRKRYPVQQKKNVSSKTALCPSFGCKHPLSQGHTAICQTIHNNNMIKHHSTCICPISQANSEAPHRLVNCNHRVAMLLFIAFMVLPFIPATNILFYVGFVVAERVLYIPSVGFCLLLGLGAGILTKDWRRRELRNIMFMLSLLVTLGAMSGYTVQRNMDWRDEESLFRSALHINPPKAYGNLGSVLISQGRLEEAEVAFDEALKHRPNMAEVHYNLGIILQKQSRYEEAINSFQNAITFRPSMALAYLNLGTSLLAEGRLSEAVNVLLEGSKVDGARVRDRREHDAARVSALVQLADLFSQRGKWKTVLAVYEMALQILPETNAPIASWTRHRVLLMAVEAYMQVQDWSQAEYALTVALQMAPQHVGTHVSMANIISKNSNRAYEAEKWFKKAVKLAPEDPSIRDQLGMFLHSQNRLIESAMEFVMAAKLAATDGARAFNAARALRDAGEYQSAENWYAQAVQLSPEDAEYHSNLGAILHLNGKYAEAYSSYQRVLQLQPNNEIAIINLKRLKSLMNK